MTVAKAKDRSETYTEDKAMVCLTTVANIAKEKISELVTVLLNMLVKIKIICTIILRNQLICIIFLFTEQVTQVDTKS